MKVKNSSSVHNAKGQVFYGMHFYPGVAEYTDPDKGSYRIFLNEDTLRGMDPTFTGRPVFVRHVDGVDESVDELRKEADGWVIESFYNRADGKHWAKFIVCSERGLKAIKQGMRLSNCYVPKSFSQGGLWNGVSYTKEITAGEYEHLAIVPDPRYEESIILTPEQFKQYNEDKELDLKRFANRKGDTAVKFFKRAKVENAVDLEETCVVLPKSKRELTLGAMVNEFDQYEMDKKEMMANGDHFVEVGGKKMTVNELVAKHQAVCDALAGKEKEGEATENADSPLVLEKDGDEEAEVEEHKKKTANAKDGEGEEAEGDAEETAESETAEEKEAAEAEAEGSEAEAEAAAAEAEKKKNEADELARKRKEAKEKADRVRNARPRPEDEETARVDLGEDRVKRGQKRYGS